MPSGASSGLQHIRGVRHHVSARADGTDPREPDGLTISTDCTARTHLHADLSSSAAETVATALHALTDPPTDGDTRTASRRRADALVRMAELALARLECAGPDGPTRALPAASIVVDWQTLTGETWGRMDGDHTGPSSPPTSNDSSATPRSVGS